ncbi:hypothetical protein B7P43_G17900 [Cryptotermes secundus]|uniref:Endonuclease/exonuclease/phosphatase domain-containing protein n=1 Tax=Cryptotermes secundus TaxID=105785 RepID=A0A2J7QCR5_9NEOP|nr:hypothetical protein B7P43_G17900 [Cryptotermes secundus]
MSCFNHWRNTTWPKGSNPETATTTGKRGNVNEPFKQALMLEIVKQTVWSSIRIPKMSVKTLWRSWPPPKRENRLPTSEVPANLRSFVRTNRKELAYMLRLFNEDQGPLQESPEKVVRRVEGWCEMATSLQGVSVSLLSAVAEEILKYKLDSAGVQKVRWDGGGIAPAGDYTFFYGTGKENHELEDKIDDIKDRFYKELEHVFDKFPNNDNGVTVVNFATSKNLTVKSTTFPHRNIHKFTWTSPDGKIHNQIDHILIDRRWHSNILDVRLFGAADCDTDYYLVEAKVRERLAVSKQTTHRVHIERFNLKKLNEVEGKEQYCV